MALEKWQDNNVLHEAGAMVQALEIILSGSVEVSIGKHSILLGAGFVLGMTEEPGKEYRFTYMAKGDVTTYSYTYTKRDDLEKLLHVNQKIAPTITSAIIKGSMELYRLDEKIASEAKECYNSLMEEKKSYPLLCQEAGEKMQDFPELDGIKAPAAFGQVMHWQSAFFAKLESCDDILRKIYETGSDMCSGFAYAAADFIDNIRRELVAYHDYLQELSRQSAAFSMHLSSLKSKKMAIEQGEDASMPSMEHLMDRILMYAGVDPQEAQKFKALMASYKKFSDRGASTDELRNLRRKISKGFYPIYEGAFLHYMTDAAVPPEIQMFLTFGVMDETLLKEEQLRRLYGYAVAHRKDPMDRILTIPEWLEKIFRLEVDPSRNEFDLDYPSYLRECRTNGEIDEYEEEVLLNDREHRLHFEISNLLTLGNRMTFGRISSFFPVMDDVNVLTPLDRGYMSTEKVREAFDEVRSSDYTIFCRNDIYSNPEQNVTQIPIHREVLPYVILMPNVGSRCVLWQEIEGKKRTSPGRMLMPIFQTADLADSVMKLCGEFRWEMCKTEQGVHWNDLSDPSLTAEYSDYLQFFKKNSNLSGDYKEKVKRQLQKMNNNFKNVFVSDYLSYMKFERKGALRLNKVTREILFKYCPFTGESLGILGSNPQYEQLIGRHKNHQNQAKRPIIVTIKRFDKEQIPRPKELMDEITYLER